MQLGADGGRTLIDGALGPEEEASTDEPDIQRMIRELADTGADPFWVMEAITLEQEAATERRAAAAAGTRTAAPARPRPRLRVVAGRGCSATPSTAPASDPKPTTERE
jgi:hypothetical protein